MSINRLGRRIDAASARLVDRLDRFRPLDPSDRDGDLGDVARLNELLNRLNLLEEESRARQAVLGEAQATLEIERQRHQDLADLVPVAILMTTPSGLIERANRAAADLFGVPAGYLIGKPLAVWIIDLAPSKPFFSNLSKLKGKATGPLVFEERLRARGGKIFHARMTVSAGRGLAGNVAGLQWVVTELDEAVSPSVPREDRPRQALDAAQASVPDRSAAAYYRSLFDGAADAIVLFDADRRVFDGNLAAHTFLGYGRGELEQLRLDDLTVCDVEKLDILMERLRNDGRWRGELEVRQKNGATAPMDASIASVTVRGGLAFRTAFREVFVRGNGQEERTRAQDELVAMISHELMNPLSGIQLHAELLKMLGVYRETSVDAILSSVRDEQRLVDDLLDLVRTDSVRLRLQPSHADLLPLLRTCIAAFRTATNVPILRLDAPAELRYGYWDRGRIQQVFHNLIANAVKYSPRDSEITVRVEDLSDRVQVSVIDQGIGIDAEALPFVFDRFFRVDADRTGTRGLGLGLYIAGALVGAHGGSITAESEIGRGSVFRVTLPYVPPVHAIGASAELTAG